MDEANCGECWNEKNEFINGTPPCYSGKCKHFGPFKNDERAPFGSLSRTKVGLDDFFRIANTAINLCPYDSHGFPTAPPSEVTKIAKINDFAFWELLTILLNGRTKKVSMEMKRRQQEANRKRAKNGKA